MRRSPTDPRPAARPRRARGTAAVTVASAALLLPLLGAAPPAGTARDSAGRLQDAFTAAAARYDVPRSVLLGVSYLQSRWDAHGGAPSVTGGYGPMHLTDARTALAGAPHHSEGTEDPRGDESRPLPPPPADLPREARLPYRLRTLPRAAELTGIPAGRLRTDAAANVTGGAALLAAAQRELGRPTSTDPADWYAAVARFSGADDRATAAAYADDVFEVLRTGERRTTDSGERVTLAAEPGLRPDTAQLARAGLRAAATEGTECPATVSCEWLPAPYKDLGAGKYGNHDKADRPASQRIEYIVVHDTEETWDRTLQLVQNPAYVAWHYSLRSTDGHVAQHLRTKDVGWHAGNWYVNSTSIGLEHEGFLASPDAWYTEAMYRSSARLVRYLAAKYRIPLDRQHILGHDNVPGALGSNIPGMHTDPGPYWDWQHYFTLLGKPFTATAGPQGGLVTIAPEFAAHRPQFTGCTGAGKPCAAHGSSAVRLHVRPDATSPLVRDIGLRPGGGGSTTDVNDIGSRVSTGQQYAVADRSGDWTAIWYLGQKAWFHDPSDRPTALHASGSVVTPRRGVAQIPVYGRAYPEKGAYPAGVPAQPVSRLPYRLPAGQRYVIGGEVPGEYFHAPAFDTSGHRVVTGEDRYYGIQFGHRVAYVRAADVQVLGSAG
ncbi:amidase [Streptomyces ruber]|uniref:N-acetylmuramoyl-L-alanine amidase n=2 Tax=Streptomyces TaxID=1883 RepID=A0A918BC94_9ACTN|nr:N-acetylmuramoyl-L-alanine amidase [Streptomyces ruber]GGQ50141.1 amidase [Streptomyces ruber]